jgi:hypothetical protein
MLEHKLARTAALALAPPQALTESSRSISSSSSSRSRSSSSNELPPPQPQQPPPQPLPPPPPPLAASRPVVHADELQAQIDSELAHTREELMGLLSRSTGVATSLTSGLAGYRIRMCKSPMNENEHVSFKRDEFKKFVQGWRTCHARARRLADGSSIALTCCVLPAEFMA